ALFELPPFSLSAEEKDRTLRPIFEALTAHHRANCPPYAAMLQALPRAGSWEHLEELPFLPVGLFKQLDLRSFAGEPTRTIRSSGTGGQVPARIWLDSDIASLQRQALAVIGGDLLGSARLPMLILDSPQVLRPPLSQTARGAGVLGFSVCASRRAFALREDMSLDVEGIRAFLDRWGGGPFFLFGFTFMVWAHFCQALLAAGLHPDCSKGILIHGGGWKSLQREAVSPAQFQAGLFSACGLRRIHDYYGMAEQAGSVFLACEEGHLHCSNFSQVFVRRPRDFSAASVGEAGILQVLSVLPWSYPGHSLLTEDEGVLLGEDDCPCGRKGRYFSVTGRLPKAELRGCSDVYGAGLGQ
ncbi:MAG: acyl-protein synthetase, partial [Pseudoflavonifractor sp.]